MVVFKSVGSELKAAEERLSPVSKEALQLAQQREALLGCFPKLGTGARGLESGLVGSKSEAKWL